MVRTNDVEKGKEKLLFKCRLCGCSDYKGVYGSYNITSISEKLYPFAFQCLGCSAIFGNPLKFTKKDNEQ